MKTMTKLTMAWITLALLFAGCSAPLSPSSQTAAKPKTQAGPTGTLTISLPAVAPWLAAQLNKSDSKAARAFLHAAKALVEVLELQSDGTWYSVVETQVETSTNQNNNYLLAEVKKIPVGENYRVKVSIFSSASDTTPAVVGIQDGVRVYPEGQSWVTVVCLPQVKAANQLDASASSGPTTFTGKVEQDGEVWYSLKLKPKTGYNLKWESPDGLVGYVFNVDGYHNNEMFPNDDRYNDSPDERPIYFGLSGLAGAGNFSLTVTLIPGSLIEGTVTFPEGSQNREATLYLADSDGNGRWMWNTRVSENLTETYWIPSVSEGTYTLNAKVEDLVTWDDNSRWSKAGLPGDLVAPETTLVVDGTKAVKVPTVASWSRLTGANSVIEGTLSLPAQVEGWKYRVLVDTSLSGGTTSLATSDGMVWGDTVDFRVEGIPAGTYFVYAIVTPHEIDNPSPGDFVAVYGMASFDVVPTTANFTVAKDSVVRCDLTALGYNGQGQGEPAPTGTGTLLDAASSVQSMGLSAVRLASKAMGDGLSTMQITGWDGASGPPAVGSAYPITFSADNGVQYSDGTITYSKIDSENSWALTMSFNMEVKGSYDYAGTSSMSAVLHVAVVASSTGPNTFTVSGPVGFNGELNDEVKLADLVMTDNGTTQVIASELLIGGKSYTYTWEQASQAAATATSSAAH